MPVMKITATPVPVILVPNDLSFYHLLVYNGRKDVIQHIYWRNLKSNWRMGLSSCASVGKKSSFTFHVQNPVIWFRHSSLNWDKTWHRALIADDTAGVNFLSSMSQQFSAIVLLVYDRIASVWPSWSGISIVTSTKTAGPRLNVKTVFPGMGSPS